MRPDVNGRYNQNGWPSVVLLSSEGEILWGGVYVTPQQMLYYLGHVRRYYSEHRHEISSQVHQLQDQRLQQSLCSVFPPHGPLLLSTHERGSLLTIPEEAGGVLRDLYDPTNGGFTLHPNLKFPHADAHELLLWLSQHQYPEYLPLVCRSLQHMREDGLWDEEGGGFFRYSAASDWSAPHTEKMLEENAALLRLLLHTAQATRDPQWYDLARQLVAYVKTTLWQDELGIFSGSQSADSEYYEPGPYSRESRQAPPVDTVVYTDWNARMISAFLLASRVLEDETLYTIAIRALDYLCSHLLHPQSSMYHFSLQGHPDLPGQLVDQVWTTRALLDAYAIDPNRRYLQIAHSLMYFACDTLLNTHNGLFYDYPADSHANGRLSLREQPLQENALAAECFLQLSTYGQRQNLHEIALTMLASCLDRYHQTGIHGAFYAGVIARALENHWL